MAINQEQATKLQAWLNAKGITPNCPACGRNNWIPGDVIAAPVFVEGGVSIGGQTVPMVQVICGNCANVRLFAAVPIGLAR